jgi:hypothetical protein
MLLFLNPIDKLGQFKTLLRIDYMLKETSYKEKFSILKDWLPTIFETVKKDLRNEHLRQDPNFIKRYFTNKNSSKLTNEELLEGYTTAIQSDERAEEISEYIFNRWLIKNSEIYNFFEETLTQLCPNFTELEELDTGTSIDIMEDAIKKFGAQKTYLFSIINSVVFPHNVYDQLRHRAKECAIQEEVDTQKKAEWVSLASVQQNYELQLNRLTSKYEQKLLGLQKKYFQDVSSLKKQISILQRKLNDN